MTDRPKGARIGWPEQWFGRDEPTEPVPTTEVRYRVRVTDHTGERAMDAWYQDQPRALDYAVRTVRSGRGVWRAEVTRQLVLGDVDLPSVVHIATVRHAHEQACITAGRS